MKENIIQTTEQYVKSELEEDATGHDWFHIDRVRRNALYILKKESGGDSFIVEMAALLHDIPDEKLNNSKEQGEQKLTNFLNTLQIDGETQRKIKDIIDSISFRGGNQTELTSIEARIVQDADRLDAIGAIGITRAFAYGGKKGQPIYDPALSVRKEMTLEEYRKGRSSSIHHFYEKLLILKDQLNTETARKIALKRHAFMKQFLEEFYNDWNGNYEINID